jgi:hypothetical protein
VLESLCEANPRRDSAQGSPAVLGCRCERARPGEPRGFHLGRVLSKGDLEAVRALREEVGDAVLRTLVARAPHRLDRRSQRFFEVVLSSNRSRARSSPSSGAAIRSFVPEARGRQGLLPGRGTASACGSRVDVRSTSIWSGTTSSMRKTCYRSSRRTGSSSRTSEPSPTPSGSSLPASRST